MDLTLTIPDEKAYVLRVALEVLIRDANVMHQSLGIQIAMQTANAPGSESHTPPPEDRTEQG